MSLDIRQNRMFHGEAYVWDEVRNFSKLRFCFPLRASNDKLLFSSVIVCLDKSTLPPKKMFKALKNWRETRPFDFVPWSISYKVFR